MKLSEKIKEVLDFLRLEASRDELTENFEILDRKIEQLLMENDSRRGKIEGNKLFEKLLDEERKLLLETRRIIRLIRLEKIVNLIGKKKDIKNLTKREEEIFDLIRETLETKITEEKERKRIIAVALRDIPAFVGVSGFEYGPFKPGDVIKINEEDLKMLIKRGFVKVVGEK